MTNVLKHKKLLVAIADILLLPAMVTCEKLSDIMLSQYSQCPMMRLGGQCVTCGGTHFVNTLLNGRLWDAFTHNQLLFVLTVMLAFSHILLNLYFLFDLKFAKRILAKIYSIPVLIITTAAIVLFFFIRNIPVFIHIIKLLFVAF